MKRSTPPLQYLAAASTAAAATTTTATISSRPYFGGGRDRRGRGRRNYSDQPPSADQQQQQLVTGDSHIHFVRDANRGFRPSGNFSGYPPGLRPYAPRPPPQAQPPYYNPSHPYGRQQRPGWRSFGPNQPYYRSQRPRGPFDNNQQLRPPQQQFRPQRSKPLDYRNWEYAKLGPPPQCGEQDHLAAIKSSLKEVNKIESGIQGVTIAYEQLAAIFRICASLDRFKILSYNILADYLVRNHQEKLYKHIPPQFLDWQWRKRSIIFELRLWSADILCLQEVDRFQELEEELKLQGYNGIWKMRTGDPIDGCAIFWRASRFMLVHEESIELNKLGLRDNVAQICVFEFVGRNNNSNESAPSTSSVCHNKVVVCNIHVLFNPKRGEIKLGQIRILFERAYAVSKLWDDAPIVICGDFNSTPKSPLYNFIQEQKLDLVELPRDKISGQASAEIPPRRPSAYSGVQSGVNTALDSTVASGRKTKEIGSPSNIQRVDHSNINSVMNMSSVASVTTGDANENGDEQPRGTHHNKESCEPEMTSRSGDPEQNPSTFILQKGPPISDLSHITHKHTSEESLEEDIYFGLTESGSEERESISSGATIDASNKCLDSDPSTILESSCKEDRHSTAREINSSNRTSNEESEGTLTLDISSERSDSLKVLNQESSGILLYISNANGNDYASSSLQYNASHESSIDLVLDDKMERLSLSEALGGSKEDDSVGEDCDTFLSELHDTTNFFPSESGEAQTAEFEELDFSSRDDTSTVDLEVNGIEKSTYDPSAWTPMEIETATGSATCTVMEHPLKLKSVYGEVEDRSGTRDSNGEPLVTSYHRRFLGTVDYIWRSEGLQTVGVLAPIPKQAMQWTPGFPTKKWGSDHIALVSELAFTKDISAQHTEVQ